MSIVQDANNDLIKERDTLMVEITQLDGTITYDQNERKLQADARQNSINDIQKAY
jgi:hypothetical protein